MYHMPCNNIFAFSSVFGAVKSIMAAGVLSENKIIFDSLVFFGVFIIVDFVENGKRMIVVVKENLCIMMDRLKFCLVLGAVVGKGIVCFFDVSRVDFEYFL